MASDPVAAKRTRLLITTGDVDGIGWEVTAKALCDLGRKPNVQYVCFRQSPTLVKTASRSAQKNLGSLDKKLRQRFKVHSVTSMQDAIQTPFDAKTLVEIQSTDAPPKWVEAAAHACMKRQFSALVTAPLSKTSIVEAGLSDLGHTEILARMSRTRSLFMGFIGNHFSVVLATGHSSLSEAIRQLNAGTLKQALTAAESLRSLLSPKVRRRPIAILGLNPHAGESGLIGREERWIGKFIDSSQTRDLRLVGPLVPDAAFLPHNWNEYSVYVSLYHDQGLIPFKLVHGFEGGVHLTLGLPFVRTSVDHGSAKDIFGQNKAKHGSMKDAIVAAIRLIEKGQL